MTATVLSAVALVAGGTACSDGGKPSAPRGGAQSGPQNGPQGQSGTPTAPQAPPPYRGELQATVDLAADAAFFVSQLQVMGSVQWIVAIANDDTGSEGESCACTDVTVHDPGTYDPAAALGGKRVDVNGRPAYFVKNLAIGGVGTTGNPDDQRADAVVWQDAASGAWAVVSGPAEATLLKVARAVRFGPPRDVTGPVRFTYLPPGLEAGAVQRATQAGLHHWEMSFVPTGQPPAKAFLLDGEPPANARLTVNVDPEPAAEFGQRVRVGNYEGWYEVLDNSDIPGRPAKETRLDLTIGKCGMWFVVPEAAVSFDEMARMVVGATITDCTGTASWTKPFA